jgi:biopolymer transport protein ExbB/TolQ
VLEALTTLLFLAGGISLMVLTLRRLKDMRLSNLQSGSLTPLLDAALRNGDTSAIVTLCQNYDDSSLSRIVKSVVARADAVSGTDGLRSDALKLLVAQAARCEIDRISRGLGALRATAITSAPIGVVIGAMAFTSATSSTELSDAMIYAAEGFILSIIAFIAYKFLSAKADAEVEAVEELCDHLHGLLLSRRHESTSSARAPR